MWADGGKECEGGGHACRREGVGVVVVGNGEWGLGQGGREG